MEEGCGENPEGGSVALTQPEQRGGRRAPSPRPHAPTPTQRASRALEKHNERRSAATEAVPIDLPPQTAEAGRNWHSHNGSNIRIVSPGRGDLGLKGV